MIFPRDNRGAAWAVGLEGEAAAPGPVPLEEAGREKSWLRPLLVLPHLGLMKLVSGSS